MMTSDSKKAQPRDRGLRARAVVAVLLCASVLGCTRLGERLEPVSLGAGAPEVQDVLKDLAANDSAIANFKATGAFTLESPELKGVRSFREGFIAFRRPADLCVIGRKYLGAAVFRLTCVGSEFLIEFPATHEEPYYRMEGEHFSSVRFAVSPSDIAREMFLPETWAEVKPGDVRLTDYDAAKQTATVEVGPKRAPRRRMTVAGPPWHVVRSERLDEKGRTLAITTKEKYTQIEGVLFPTDIDARFPTEETRMTFGMRKVWPNTPLDESLFDIKARAREAGVDVNRSEQPKRAPRKRQP